MDKNRLIMEFGCDARNEAVARVVVAAMLTRTNPTLSEVEDVKTAVSEAVTNSIEERTLYITITDHGCGIENVDRAMEPLYTTVTDGSRSGMGFSFMEAFMDELKVESRVGEGTVVNMKKIIGKSQEIY